MEHERVARYVYESLMVSCQASFLRYLPFPTEIQIAPFSVELAQPFSAEPSICNHKTTSNMDLASYKDQVLSDHISVAVGPLLKFHDVRTRKSGEL